MIYKTKRMPKLIVVDADGDIITSANGQLSSDNRELVRIIKREVLFRRKVQLVVPFGEKVRASLSADDVIGNTAALFSARPGRTRLLEAPPEIWEWFKKENEQKACIGNMSSGNNFRFNETTDAELDIVAAYFEGEDKTGNSGRSK